MLVTRSICPPANKNSSPLGKTIKGENGNKKESPSQCQMYCNSNESYPFYNLYHFLQSSYHHHKLNLKTSNLWIALSLSSSSSSIFIHLIIIIIPTHPYPILSTSQVHSLIRSPTTPYPHLPLWLFQSLDSTPFLPNSPYLYRLQVTGHGLRTVTNSYGYRQPQQTVTVTTTEMATATAKNLAIAIAISDTVDFFLRIMIPST